MSTSFFARKSILSNLTSVFTIAALVIQLTAPLIVWAEDTDSGAAPETTTEVVSDAPQDSGEVLGDETSSSEDKSIEEAARITVEQPLLAEPGTIVIHATKIICDVETDLPNWGSTTQAVNDTTATDFLATHPGCHAQAGWNFQWSHTAPSPGDNFQMGLDANGWNTFGLTDENGVTTTEIDAANDITVRSEVRGGYVNYSGIDDHHNGVSAETICGAPTTTHRYDNMEKLGVVTEGMTYYCIGFSAPKPQTAEPSPAGNLVATKIVCDLESDLPDWAGTNHPITATTATDFLATHPGCHAQAGWNFQWSHTAPSPGDNKQLGGDGWTLIGPTDVNGTVVTTVPVANDITVREERRGGYIGFSGIDNHHNGVSAEMLCGSPVGIHKYDNMESLGAMTEGTTYYCVAFNPVQPAAQPAPTCDANVNLIQNGDFESPSIANGTYSIVPSSNPLLKWLTAWLAPQSNGILGLEIQRNVAGSPFSGNQFAELDGDHPVTMWQNIATIPGKEYKLDFRYSARPNVATADNKIDVKVNGVVLGAQLAGDGTSLSDTNWTAQSRTFVATGTTTKVEFADAGADTSLGGYLDNVKLSCQGDPVPPTPTQPAPTTGSIEITNYSCTPGTTVVRSANGVGKTVPETCTLQAGKTFGYVHGSATDPYAPHPELTEPLTAGGVTSGSGILTISNLPATGRYLIEETNGSNQRLNDNQILGLYCEGDGDLSDNNDNQEITFVPAGGVAHCVAYNPAPVVVVTDDNTNSRQSMGNAGRFMSKPNTLGEVLGASTTDAVEAALAQCTEYLHSYVKVGQTNDKSDVIRLQTFLNEYLGTKLRPTGKYDNATYEAVRKFQVQTAKEVLEPWKATPGGINEKGTGYVFKTTKRMINMIKCPALNIAMPILS